jgi:hypothetical protein
LEAVLEALLEAALDGDLALSFFEDFTRVPRALPKTVRKAVSMWRLVCGLQWRTNQSPRDAGLCHRDGKTMSELTAREAGLICAAMDFISTSIASAKRRRRSDTARMRARA